MNIRKGVNIDNIGNPKRENRRMAGKNRAVQYPQNGIKPRIRGSSRRRYAEQCLFLSLLFQPPQ